jgi:hypothetical protein
LFCCVLTLVGVVLGSGKYCMMLRATALMRLAGMMLFGNGSRVKRPGLAGSALVVSGS